MNKKKWLTILTASALASSAIVVTNPASAATVSEAEKLVKTAKDAGTVLKWAISIEGTADGKTRPWKQYNDAKNAYNQAVAAVNKLTSSKDKVRLLAELDEHVNIHIIRCMHYIDAITAGEKIRAKQDLLAAQLNSNLINDATEKLYHELSAEIRKQGVLLDRVYGKSTRDLIRSQYKGAAEQVRDRAKYGVTVKMELDLAEKALAAKKYDEAQKHFEEAEKYLKYVTNTVIKNKLNDRIKTFDHNFAPRVEKVSAVEPYRITVHFSKAMLSGTGTNSAENVSNYSVSGHSIKKVTLSDDKKVATLELYYPLNTDNNYSVTVKKNIRTADNKTLSDKDHVASFKFVDNIRPTVSSVNSLLNGTVEVLFSELISKDSPLSIKINGKQVQYNTLTSDTDKVIIPKAELDKLSLQRGRSYSIVVTGAHDLVTPYPNTMSQYSKTFIYNPAQDNVAPTLTSITRNGEKGFIVQFSETLSAFSASNLVITKGSTTIRPSSVKDISDGSKLKFEVELPTSIYGSNESTAYLNIQIKDIKDLQNNTAPSIYRSLTLTKDMAGPIFDSIAFIADKNEIHVKFNEVLSGTIDRSKIKVYNGDNIDFTPSINTSGNTLIIDSKNLPDGLYVIIVEPGAVKDNSIAQNINERVTTSVYKKLDSVKPTATLLDSTRNGEFIISFSEPVDEDSVKVLGNILIDNKNLPDGTAYSFSADKRLLTIILPEGKIPSTKSYRITLRNIKDLSDNIMNTMSSTISIKDNTKPTLKGAVLLSNGNIKLTFSENINLPDIGVTNFDIFVDDNKLQASDYAVSTSSRNDELIISSKSETTFSNEQKIVITTTDNTTIRDAANNTLKSGTSITIE